MPTQTIQVFPARNIGTSGHVEQATVPANLLEYEGALIHGGNAGQWDALAGQTCHVLHEYSTDGGQTWQTIVSIPFALGWRGKNNEIPQLRWGATVGGLGGIPHRLTITPTASVRLSCTLTVTTA
jgi:hypothetical protein